MNSNDAQAALADVHRMQERSRDEYVRQQFTWPYLLLTALGVFVALASGDLPAPWGTAAFLAAEAVLIGTAVLQRRRASVRLKAKGPDTLFVLGGAVAVIVAYVAFNVVTSLGVVAFDLPAPRTFAAAGVALLFLLLAGPSRRVYRSLVRHA
ncbi:hypothetical protein [Actinomadura sp. WAC 06369]|uniref:hypothetical protein n=1 Tax=Actinomadura sp. WAC 06369 TaxID=2203193 RepID=UPI000F779FB6|nr:hypothetical protein [Actinomadura sp. WAC 06369]RSN56532.1 hypothetical protein DMH08_25300 [Actinomadura sp. WAC 06369]